MLKDYAQRVSPNSPQLLLHMCCKELSANAYGTLSNRCLLSVQYSLDFRFSNITFAFYLDHGSLVNEQGAKTIQINITNM